MSLSMSMSTSTSTSTTLNRAEIEATAARTRADAGRMDRLRPLVDFKKNREDRAAVTLRAARSTHDERQQVVEAHREVLLRERVRCDDVDLFVLGDLADQHTRDQLKSAEAALAEAAAAVDDARGQHQAAALEHRALQRLYERRQEEAAKLRERKEQRMLDELAAR